MADFFGPYLSTQGIKQEFPRPKIFGSIEEEKEENKAVVAHPEVKKHIMDLLRKKRKK